MWKKKRAIHAYSEVASFIINLIQRNLYVSAIIIVIVFFGIWGLAHWNSKEGEKISVWFGLIEYTKQERNSHIASVDEPLPVPPPTLSKKTGETYSVILVLPSRMSGSEIFIDGEPATILQQTETIVTLRVEGKEEEHTIIIKKGDNICNKKQIITQDDLKIYPCQ